MSANKTEKAAVEALNAHLQETLRWHFSPETGCPYWLQWRERKGIDPIKEVSSFEDLSLFGAFNTEAIAEAQKKLQPAQAGWNQADAAEFTALRRWIRRPDRIANDPFGNPTVRANMHAGRNWDDVTGESGPEDPDLTLISIQDLKGKPLAILANFSMHYFSGVKAISSDYFGKFATNLNSMLEADESFVGIMSHGCSGDIWRRDYTLRNWAVNPPKKGEEMKIDAYAKGLAERALVNYRKIKHRPNLDLAMAETRMTLKYRVPDVGLLQWAEGIVEEMGDRNPKTKTEVYAFEQTVLHERQQTEIVLQSLRIGDMAITTTPNETYALTGLKLKARSPLSKTMVIELANGGDGYIPPPEQHFLGGYNTWAARSAGLEVQAEPKITEACLRLLEKVAAKPRRVIRPGGTREYRFMVAGNRRTVGHLPEGLAGGRRRAVTDHVYSHCRGGRQAKNLYKNHLTNHHAALFPS